MRRLSQYFRDEFAKDVDYVGNMERDGVSIKQYKSRGVSWLKAKLFADNHLGRPVGNYFTFEIEKYEQKVFKELKILLGNAIAELLPPEMDSVLILGMGNSEIVSDALGIKTLNRIDVMPLMELSHKKIAKFCPGVYSVSGIESYDVVKSLVEGLCPDAVIVVDSLCTQELSRLGKSFQVSDAGIVPGSAMGKGVCNLSSETMGCRVISVGVPVVVYLQSIIENAINKSTPNPLKGWSAENLLSNLDAIFSPKDIDYIISIASHIIADSIVNAII